VNRGRAVLSKSTVWIWIDRSDWLGEEARPPSFRPGARDDDRHGEASTPASQLQYLMTRDIMQMPQVSNCDSRMLTHLHFQLDCDWQTRAGRAVQAPNNFRSQPKFVRAAPDLPVTFANSGC
jgi:hypothetical protein